MFYNIFRLITKLVMVFFRVEIEGLENIKKEGSLVIAGNHTKWLDPILLVSLSNRKISFLTKKELFKGITKPIVKAMGCIPVDRKKHDHDALISAYKVLDDGGVIGIFPEGTINRTKDVILPFKIGAVKMANKTNTEIVPFVIKGKYKFLRKSIKIKFLKSIKIGNDLEKENKRLEDIISNNLR